MLRMGFRFKAQRRDRPGQMDRTTTSSNKINFAVQRGLAECRHSVAPIVSLARFIDDLKAEPNWTTAEVQEVETAVRHILARLVAN